MILLKQIVTLALCLFCFFINGQIPGAHRIELYKEKLMGKRIAFVGNHTSTIGKVHLVDTLVKQNVNIVRIFGPEHGFRGQADAGQKIKSETDSQTGIKIISLYGKHVKPSPAELSDIDIVVFDIQDVGVRFFTYLSTLKYIMEACAENQKELIVLDRPNPNISCIDGPVLEPKYRSFVGLTSVPILYGMTIGEYALMLNGEKWLKNGLSCKLTVIPCGNYTRNSEYELPFKPSPNLPNMQSVYLYASLALFEGTFINVGRGTDFPFQVFGHPELDSSTISYTPAAKPGAMFPPHKDTLCQGIDLRSFSVQTRPCFSLQWLKFAYEHSPNKTKFFNRFFYNLSGSAKLKEQIEKGFTESEIRETWREDLDQFKKIRSRYLIYN